VLFIHRNMMTTPRNKIQEAIASYESADKDKCLEVVRTLIQQFSTAQQFGAEVEVRQIDGGSKRAVRFSPSHTVLNWLTLAAQRLVKETCDPDEIALVPVLTCLNTALKEID